MGTTTLLIVLNLFGMFPGYISFGWVADHLGRRKSFVLYLFAAALLVPFYAMARSQAPLLVLGAVVAFFGTGFFSGSGHYRQRDLSDAVAGARFGIYLQRRARSEFASLLCDWMGWQIKGLDWAFYLCAAAFLLAEFDGYAVAGDEGKERWSRWSWSLIGSRGDAQGHPTQLPTERLSTNDSPSLHRLDHQVFASRGAFRHLDQHNRDQHQHDSQRLHGAQQFSEHKTAAITMLKTGSRQLATMARVGSRCWRPAK